MNYREVTIYTGEVYNVPSNINRLDDKATHGWQVRYGETKEAFFADGIIDPTGAEKSLKKAIEELKKRIAILEAPTRLRNNPCTHKNTELPAGVSGPTLRFRKGRNTAEISYQVSFPRFGLSSTTKKVYVGTENTATQEKHAEAIEMAIKIRKEAVEKYQFEATEHKRKTAEEA